MWNIGMKTFQDPYLRGGISVRRRKEEKSFTAESAEDAEKIGS